MIYLTKIVIFLAISVKQWERSINVIIPDDKLVCNFSFCLNLFTIQIRFLIEISNAVYLIFHQ